MRRITSCGLLYFDTPNLSMKFVLGGMVGAFSPILFPAFLENAHSAPYLQGRVMSPPIFSSFAAISCTAAPKLTQAVLEKAENWKTRTSPLLQLTLQHTLQVNLERLDLSCNLLNRINSGLTSLTSLQQLNLKNNVIRKLPIEVR